MTLAPAVVLMIVGGSITSERSFTGGVLFIVGFLMAAVAITFLGPSSYHMDVTNGHVLVIRRYCLVSACVMAFVLICGHLCALLAVVGSGVRFTREFTRCSGSIFTLL